MADSEEISCKELVEVVTEYQEGTLSEAEKTRFEEHMALCPGCRVYLDQIRQTACFLGELPEAPIPEEVREQMLGLFRSWKQANH